jgi:hypothetical protein
MVFLLDVRLVFRNLRAGVIVGRNDCYAGHGVSSAFWRRLFLR